MDEQGIEACVLFPTLGGVRRALMMDDAAAALRQLRSVQPLARRRLGLRATRTGIFAAPLLSLLDVDHAVAELDRVLAAGARVVAPAARSRRTAARPPTRTSTRSGRASTRPASWSRFHIGESGYNELFSARVGRGAEPVVARQSAFQWTCFYGDRPIMETVAALILHNLFGRFPNVRVAQRRERLAVGAVPAGPLDKMKGMGRNGPWPGGYVDGRPSDIVKRSTSTCRRTTRRTSRRSSS